MSSTLVDAGASDWRCILTDLVAGVWPLTCWRVNRRSSFPDTTRVDASIVGHRFLTLRVPRVSISCERRDALMHFMDRDSAAANRVAPSPSAEITRVNGRRNVCRPNGPVIMQRKCAKAIWKAKLRRLASGNGRANCVSRIASVTSVNPSFYPATLEVATSRWSAITVANWVFFAVVNPIDFCLGHYSPGVLNRFLR